MDKKLYNYSAEVTRVVDGDTFDCMVDMGMKVYHKARVRIMGIDCPERGSSGFIDSRAWADDKLYGQRIWISSQGTDSFGRWLCWVWRVKDPNPWDLADTFGDDMIRAGHATRYQKK